MSPSLLTSLSLGDIPFTLKELQPTKDKMNFELCEGKLKKLDEVVQIYAKITAWNQLRSAGRQGSAIADELIEFASTDGWQVQLLEYCFSYVKTVQNDYKDFMLASRDGFFKK